MAAVAWTRDPDGSARPLDLRLVPAALAAWGPDAGRSTRR